MKMTSDVPTSWTLTEKHVLSWKMDNADGKRLEFKMLKAKSKSQKNANECDCSSFFFLNYNKFKHLKNDIIFFLLFFMFAIWQNICKWGCWSLKPERKSTLNTSWTSGTVFASNTRGVELEELCIKVTTNIQTFVIHIVVDLFPTIFKPRVSNEVLKWD